MAEKLLTTSIAAPGFNGLNTQDSSVSLDNGYATVANNCVIDKFGRIGARKGWTANHASNSDLSTEVVHSIGELITADGTSYVIVGGNDCIFKLVGSTLTKLTYGGGGTAPTITNSNWQMAALNNVLFLYQAGHDPLIFDPTVSDTTYRRVSEKSGYLGTAAQNNCVIAAYGRTWSANNASAKSTIQFSDLLAGHVLTTGTAGTNSLYPMYFGDWQKAFTIVDRLNMVLRRYDQTLPGFITFFGEKRIATSVVDVNALIRYRSTGTAT